ncbi:hypothetical protein Tco_0439331 [Tanacetum coccineum]
MFAHRFLRSSSPSECLLLEPSVGDNLTLGRSLSRHSTLEAEQINHQFWGVDNGSSLSVCLIPDSSMHIQDDPSFLLTKQDGTLIDKVPVLQVHHQVPNQFETPLVESEEDPASPQEIL